MRALPPATLALADGTLFHGYAIGAEGTTTGEVVFNTAMSGYQEILTDPSYQRQIVTLTYPHIGNVGANGEDTESDRVQLAGLVLREVPRPPSSYRAERAFDAYLRDEGVVAIGGIDTRRLTNHLRNNGAQSGCIVAGEGLSAETALEAARGFSGLKGADLARGASTAERYEWKHGSWRFADNASPVIEGGKRHVVVCDFGVKRNILRLLVDRDCRVTVVPATTSAEEILALAPDGVLLSNGPGDPEPCDYAIATARALIEAKMPTFGICLGHQILGLAAGARTLKMKFGHHGANHPVQDLRDGRVLITSQNHGFAIDEASLPAGVTVTHRSLFDGTNQGLALDDAPAFSFQGHPEASPGPRDVAGLFDDFVTMIDRHAGAART